MDKVKNLWTIICRSSSVDNDNNVISLLEIIEEITITQPLTVKSEKPEPVGGISFPHEIVSLWSRDNTDEDLTVNIKVVLETSDGKKNNQGTIPIKFEKGKYNLRVRLKSQGIPFTGFGKYFFSIFLDKGNGVFTKVQEVPFIIKSDIKI